MVVNEVSGNVGMIDQHGMTNFVFNLTSTILPGEKINNLVAVLFHGYILETFMHKR